MWQPTTHERTSQQRVHFCTKGAPISEWCRTRHGRWFCCCLDRRSAFTNFQGYSLKYKGINWLSSYQKFYHFRLFARQPHCYICLGNAHCLPVPSTARIPVPTRMLFANLVTSHASMVAANCAIPVAWICLCLIKQIIKLLYDSLSVPTAVCQGPGYRRLQLSWSLRLCDFSVNANRTMSTKVIFTKTVNHRTNKFIQVDMPGPAKRWALRCR